MKPIKRFIGEGNITYFQSDKEVMVNDYQEKREHSLEKLAKRVAKEVSETKIEAKLDSMNSYERHLVHDVLSNYKGIKTESEGEQPNRCVVIKPSK